MKRHLSTVLSPSPYKTKITHIPLAKTTRRPFWARTAQDIQTLKSELSLNNPTQVIEYLLDNMVLPTTLPPVGSAQPSSTDTTVVGIDHTLFEALNTLRRSLRFKSAADFLTWLVDEHYVRNPRPIPDPGEELFASILSYLDRKRKAKRKAKQPAE